MNRKDKIVGIIKRIENDFKIKIERNFKSKIINSEKAKLFLDKSEYFFEILEKNQRIIDNEKLRGHELNLLNDTMNIVKEKIKREPMFLEILQQILETDGKIEDIIYFFDLITDTFYEIEHSAQGIIENPGPAGPNFDIDFLVRSNYPKITEEKGILHFSNDFINWDYKLS